MRKYQLILSVLTIVALAYSCASCKNTGSQQGGKENVATPVGPEFNADSALAFCARQCEFGPRTMNSEAHERCAEWIITQFERYGCKVNTQKADLKGYDGTILRSTNIIASYRPEATTRILVCAHWDSRPWADNDPDSLNWHTPVMAANDGASGVGVMLEIARLLNASADSSSVASHIGIDFVCFDAEDWGVPQWSDATDNDSWALGAQHFAANLPDGYEARYGILLDMVGGEGAQFYQEYMSRQFAPDIVDKVWTAAEAAGYGSFFPKSNGGGVTDDHIPLNQVAHIPTIDIIAHYPDCARSSFGPTWHTISDTMDHLDKNVLKAVGQTVIQVLYSEQ